MNSIPHRLLTMAEIAFVIIIGLLMGWLAHDVYSDAGPRTVMHHHYHNCVMGDKFQLDAETAYGLPRRGGD